MKKIFFALASCMFFTFCSHKTVPPAPAGVSNVTIGSGDGKMSADKASAAYGAADKDWGFKASPDTLLNGMWTMVGMLQANGTWSTVEKNDAAAVVTPSATTTTDTAMTVSNGADKTKKSGFKRGKPKKHDPLYDAAESKLKMDYKAGSAIDTSALEPYAYWKSTPAITFSKSAFYGNTGCNSMSGSIHYNDRELQFGKNIVTSKMACMEYDEANFLSLLKKADNYSVKGNMLEIRQGTNILLTLKK